MDKLSFALILALLRVAFGRYLARYRYDCERYLVRYRYAERHHYDERETAYYTKVGTERLIVYRYPTLRKA